MREIKLKEIDYEKTAYDIGNFIVGEVVRTGYTGGIVGISGGVDSTVTAALAKRGFDRYNLNNEKELELVGYLMPSTINNPSDLEDGLTVVSRLDIRNEIIEIQPFVDVYCLIDRETGKDIYQKGNLMSEVRGLILHRKAALEKKLVIGTGNHDEDFGVGYYTLFGDGAVHMSPISGLSKRLVRGMARHLGFGDLADRTSTAGLEPGQTDFGDLGYSYGFIELISEGRAQGFGEEDLRRHPQVLKKFDDDRTRYIGTYGKAKFWDSTEAMDDLFLQNKIAESKARIVSPPNFELKEDYYEI